MADATLIDLLHLGNPGVIASYLVLDPEPALVDCGPASCVDALVDGLARKGLELEDLRHLLLTHIHPDHAGAAGTLVRRHPRLQVYVHEIGAPHLVDPTRLEQSARRLYGDDLDRLFGEIAPVPEANVHVLEGEVLGLDVEPTPGHAPHHVCFFDRDDACYAGDLLGCLLPPGDFLYMAAAPPGIDLEAWQRSLELLERRAPRVARLPHFGEVEAPLVRIRRARERLREYGEAIAAGMPEHEFVALVQGQLEREAGAATPLYAQFPSFDLTYAGIRRSVEKQREREGGS